MTAWKDKLVAEILLWLCSWACAVSWAVPFAFGREMSVVAAVASRFAFPIILSSWVASDARARCQSLYYDFDTFIFFAWPVVLPYYLFRTRGVRAFLTLLGFAGILFAAVAFAVAVYGILLLLRR